MKHKLLAKPAFGRLNIVRTHTWLREIHILKRSVGDARLRFAAESPVFFVGMSEYQYYEFQTVDRRLTEKEMRELRGYSTRARITPTSFRNEYHYGNFKGNPGAWMEKYFDGFLYLANWGTHELQIALPAGLLAAKQAERYCSTEAASVREKSGKLIFTFSLEEEPGEEWLEGDGHLSSLLQIRSELAHGDLRVLYLGWLMSVQSCELEPAELEPPVPPNLRDLSGAQKSFVDFFHLDRDLLAVAAKNSLRTAAEPADRKQLASWIESLPVREKDEVLMRLLGGEEAKVGMELRARFSRLRNASQPTALLKSRTAGELLAAVERHGAEG